MSPRDPVVLAPTAILISTAGMAVHSHLRMGDNPPLLCSRIECCGIQFSSEGGVPLSAIGPCLPFTAEIFMRL